MSSDLWYGEAWTLPVGNSKQDTKNSARVKQQQRLYVSRDLSERNGEIAHWKKHDPIFHMQGWEGRIQKWNKRGGKGKKTTAGFKTWGHSRNETSAGAFEHDVEGVRDKKGLTTTMIQLRKKKLFYLLSIR